VRVEIEWLIALAAETGVVELPTLSPATITRLRALADGLTVEDAARVKTIELTTNHDVKAVEYFLKERLAGTPELESALEFIHFACTSEDINNLSHALMLDAARTSVMRPAHERIASRLR